QQNVRDMVASGAPWQLVTTFNEWGEGTAVESATEWQSGSGYGAYLDALHTNGQGTITTPVSTAVPTSTPMTTPTLTPTVTPTRTPTPSATAVSGSAIGFIGAGDIAGCSNTSDSDSGAIIAAHPADYVFTLGDNAYDNGTSTEFANCYNPAWGGFKNRTHPAPGNHDYSTANATGYFGYFGAAAGDPTKGYYSYDLPGSNWHVIVVNSNCGSIGGCAVGNPQYVWLQADLVANSSKNVVAMWHHPRYSSGTTHGNATNMDAIWDLLVVNHVDLVLNGHEHNLEVFAPLGASDNVDTANGTREFVIGTGGKDGNYPFGAAITGSGYRCAGALGVMEFQLYGDHYTWQFINSPGSTCSTSGSQPVH
ncbi:MAG: metallophosphoesterase family protein, partial [Thermomicrobiales bacterium]